MSGSVRIEALTRPLKGRATLPGDKSIAQRALILASMAEGESHLRGLPRNADVLSAVSALHALGATIEILPSGDREPVAFADFDVIVRGWGDLGPQSAVAPIDCGESATLARLLLGTLARYRGTYVLDGSESLRQRPFARVVEPLRQMGAHIERDAFPLVIANDVTRGFSSLSAITFRTPVASAQVKSALLFAATGAHGRTRVEEPALSRDHTERMLPLFGVSSASGEGWAEISGPCGLYACDLDIPGDPSAAAFLLAAAVLINGSEIRLDGVSLNRTRLGFLRALRSMGADCEIADDEGRDRAFDADTLSAYGNELVGSIRAGFTESLHAIEVASPEIPSLIDELPLLALLAARAEGTSRFCGVGELRVKESNRFDGIVEGLSSLGAELRIEGDDLVIAGSPLWSPCSAATLDSQGDHRMAMTWALAGLCFDASVDVVGFECIGKSFPGFMDTIERLCL